MPGKPSGGNILRFETKTLHNLKNTFLQIETNAVFQFETNTFVQIETNTFLQIKTISFLQFETNIKKMPRVTRLPPVYCPLTFGNAMFLKARHPQLVYCRFPVTRKYNDLNLRRHPTSRLCKDQKYMAPKVQPNRWMVKCCTTGVILQFSRRGVTL